jgi:hypothetical protein
MENLEETKKSFISYNKNLIELQEITGKPVNELKATFEDIIDKEAMLTPLRYFKKAERVSKIFLNQCINNLQYTIALRAMCYADKREQDN